MVPIKLSGVERVSWAEKRSGRSAGTGLAIKILAAIGGNMLFKKNTTRWPVDPSRVEYGVVADKDGRNCNRTHLLVQYSADTRPREFAMART